METTITVSQALAIKQCSTSTIYRWIKQSRIDATKQNGRWNIVCNEKWQAIQKRQTNHITNARPTNARPNQTRQQINTLKEENETLRQENSQLKTEKSELLRKQQEQENIYDRDLCDVSSMYRKEIEDIQEKNKNTVQKQELAIQKLKQENESLTATQGISKILCEQCTRNIYSECNQRIKTFEVRIVDLEKVIQDQNHKILEKDSLIKKLYPANQALGIALENALARANYVLTSKF